MYSLPQIPLFAILNPPNGSWRIVKVQPTPISHCSTQIPPTEVGGSLMCCLPSQLAQPFTRIPLTAVGRSLMCSLQIQSSLTVISLHFIRLMEFQTSKLRRTPVI